MLGASVCFFPRPLQWMEMLCSFPYVMKAHLTSTALPETELVLILTERRLYAGMSNLWELREHHSPGSCLKDWNCSWPVSMATERSLPAQTGPPQVLPFFLPRTTCRVRASLAAFWGYWTITNAKPIPEIQHGEKCATQDCSEEAYNWWLKGMLWWILCGQRDGIPSRKRHAQATAGTSNSPPNKMNPHNPGLSVWA